MTNPTATECRRCDKNTANGPHGFCDLCYTAIAPEGCPELQPESMVMRTAERGQLCRTLGHVVKLDRTTYAQPMYIVRFGARTAVLKPTEIERA